MKTRKPKSMKDKEWEELKVAEVTDPSKHINLFNQIISDLLRIDVKFDEEDKERMLLASLLASYGHPVTTLPWRKETQKTKEVMTCQPCWLIASGSRVHQSPPGKGSLQRIAWIVERGKRKINLGRTGPDLSPGRM